MTKFVFLLDSQKVDFITDILRKAGAVISGELYKLVGYLLQTIFHLANFDIADLADEMMNRVYIIIGLFMLFKITVSLLNYLVNPDRINDKETGASKLIARVIISLAMLIALPGAFSIMTDLQNQLLPVLPRVIIGKDTAKTGSGSANLAKDTADSMVTAVLNGFVEQADSCPNQKILITTPDDLMANVNVKCTDNGSIYALTYHGLIALVVSVLMVYVTFSLAIATAVRAFKLIILRVIAPAPVLSYIDPKSSKSDGMFSKWTKMFISTWAELLINLGIIYFIIFMIQKLVTNNNWEHYLIAAGGEGTVQKGMILAFIIVGLFMFAREAPKFIMDALGIKNTGGFTRMLGMGATALGGIGSTVAGVRSSWAADPANGHAHTPFRVARNLLAGGAGLIGGLSAGGHALMNDKDGNFLAGINAQQKYNGTNFDRLRYGASIGGGLSSLGRSMFTGHNNMDNLEKEWKDEEDSIKLASQANSERKKIMDRAASKGIESLKTSGTVHATSGPLSKYNGFTANAADFSSTVESALAGNGVYNKYSNGYGDIISQKEYDSLTDSQKELFSTEGSYFEYNGQEVNVADAKILEHEVKDLCIADYAEKAIADSSGEFDPTIAGARDRYQDLTGTSVETTFGGPDGLKASYGRESNSISSRENALQQSKTSNATKRAKANDSYFGPKK